MSVRETNLSKENAYDLIIDNLPKLGIRVKRSDRPDRIIAEVGDWKRWLTASQPWADIKVDISQKDDRSRIEFVLDFRKMYGSYVAMLLVLYLLLAPVCVAFTAGYATSSLFFGLGLFMLLLFPIAWVTPKTHKAKEQFMSAIDRFLPSVW